MKQYTAKIIVAAHKPYTMPDDEMYLPVHVGAAGTDFWACSEDAAKWFYKEDLQSKAVIIKNAIELDRVGFSEEKREVIRNKYGISDKGFIPWDDDIDLLMPRPDFDKLHELLKKENIRPYILQYDLLFSNLLL